MRTHRIVAPIAVACLLVLGVTQPASAGLKIELVFVDGGPPPTAPDIAGGGNLQQIMQVAAERWEAVLKRGGGDWKLTIEYGWSTLRDPSQFAREFFHDEDGRPSRITHSCIAFNNKPVPGVPFLGFFADPTPRDNSEYMSFTSDAANLVDGWINVGRVFSQGIGDAANRADLLQIATHEIGHALGLDGDYSGFKTQSGSTRQVKVTAPRPFAGTELMVDNGPHLEGFSTPLMRHYPVEGERQLISGVDVLLAAQLSLFDKPDLSDPAWDVDDDDQRVPRHRTINRFSCPDVPQPNRGQW